jgi:hypothetical protein
MALASIVLGQATAADSGLISVGKFPRFESDPYIRRPTLSAEPTFTDKETEQQWEVAFKYGMPILDDRWSWQVSVPIEHVDGPGKNATGLSDIELTMNREISRGAWKQAASLQLTANTASNDQLGNGQWEIMPTYSIGHWLSPLFSTGMLLSWQYGFLVDNGKTQTDIIEPRIIFGTHMDVIGDLLALDLRPRFDLTRNEFYTTLMPFLSGALGAHFSGQFGFEFPLRQLAAKRVENSRVYIDISHGW